MSTKKKKILIAEDEIIAAMGMKDMLELWGYGPVKIAGSGEEAVKLADEFGPDLLLMDIRLSGEMDGVEAARAILSEKKIPVVFVSGYPEEDIRRRYGAEFEFSVVDKPMDFDLLEKKLATLLKKTPSHKGQAKTPARK